MDSNIIPASFRDPSGFLFVLSARRSIGVVANGELYRQVNKSYREEYDLFMRSGLAEKLMKEGLLIPHKEVSQRYAQTGDAYKVIQPERMPFISYPYEWCFSQLKDAALLTLKIQKTALEFGMSLKDASAFNVQFLQGKPIFIDTLSFEKYSEGKPWVAYRQFCQHFLAPLVLMAWRDARLNILLRDFLDGIPLDIASKLLPLRTYFKPSLLFHIHLHSRFQQYFSQPRAGIVGSDPTMREAQKMSKSALLALVDGLKNAVSKLTWRPKGTEWAEYYEGTNYTPAAFEHKKQIVAEFLAVANSKSVWDIGANTGEFSRLASDKGIPTISFDLDPAAVEKNYLETKKRGEKHILPLVMDFTNPSPAIGWANQERDSLLQRGPADTVLALALVHHLAISSNLPFSHIASFFNKICRNLIIEFVPKEDSNAQKLLSFREDIFPCYTQKDFEAEFQKHFTIKKKQQIKESLRTMYLMQNKKKSR